MKVLIACEESQAVTIELRKLGHEAYSCDILECSGGHPEWHIIDDVECVINNRDFMTQVQKRHIVEQWDMMIAFPPCTHLCVSGAKHFEAKRKDGRQKDAIKFFMMLINAKIPKISIENPVGIISGKYIATHFPDLDEKYNLPLKNSQIIQPYEFGDPVKKTTCLWLKGLPNLIGTKNVESDVKYYTSKNGAKMSDWNARQIVVNGKKCGYNTPEFKKHRSKTFPGIAKAMAEQWTL